MKKIFSIAAIIIACIGCKTVVVSPYVQTSNEGCPKVLMEGISYHLSPCKIEVTMIDGEGDVPFEYQIIPSNLENGYSFATWGTGEGLPTYSIGGGGSGGARGIIYKHQYFSDKKLNVNSNGEKKTYNGKLPIKINHSPSGAEAKTLYLDVVIHVLPALK